MISTKILTMENEENIDQNANRNVLQSVIQCGSPRRLALLEKRLASTNNVNPSEAAPITPIIDKQLSEESMNTCGSTNSRVNRIGGLEQPTVDENSETHKYEMTNEFGENRDKSESNCVINLLNTQEEMGSSSAWGVSSGNDNSRSNLKRKTANQNKDASIKSPKIVVNVEDSNLDSGSKGGTTMPPSTGAAHMLPIKHYFSTSSSNTSTMQQTVTNNLSTHFDNVDKKVSTTNKSSKNFSSNTTASTSTNSTSNSVTSTIVLELKKQLENARVVREMLDTKLLRTEKDLKDSYEKTNTMEIRNTKLCRSLEEVYRTMAIQEARRKRDRLALDCVRLGKFVPKRVGPTMFQEVWEEGFASSELNVKQQQLIVKKEELETRKKKLQGLKRGAKRTNGNTSNSSAMNNTNTISGINTTLNGGGLGGSLNSSVILGLGLGGLGGLGGEDEYEYDPDLYTESEAIRTHLEQLKREEAALIEEKRLLESEKAAHQKELKRSFNEDQSRFCKDLPFLNNRYLLLSLLGKGGFSEVWKAIDIVDLKEVALKVHQLNTMWSEERKQSYIKHVTREYKIHRDLKHPRVVQFFDVFEIDMNSFATVLEYCRGTDLDERLKREKTILEKDAKFILLQMLSGLRYLNNPSYVYMDGTLPSTRTSLSTDNEEEYNNLRENMSAHTGGTSRKRTIIHFDLKPGNILFDEFGDVKITDFGLSKIIDESNDNNTSLELTSQGAGTYWYLPPECFLTGEDAPRISSKVDIWSTGVIYYQMLYGKKPFGEGKSQEKVLAEGTILNAMQVDFPATPKVSDDAKDFIKLCLTHDQRHRPDINQLYQHPYLRSTKTGSR